MLLPPSANQARPSRRQAFTLVEMLVVMAIIIVLVSMVAPVFTSLKGAGDVSKAVYDVAGLVDQSRAYAMSNNTYVYVGFNESDATAAASARQVSGPSKVGRVAVMVVASKDGSNNVAAANLAPIGKVQIFENLHLADLTDQGKTPKAGGMARPPLKSTDTIDPKYNVGRNECVSVTKFEYPVGQPDGAGQYTFSKVIQFEPQGVARITQSVGDETIVKQIEIGLQQSHANVVSALAPPVISGGVAAIQVDGMTGSTHIYRP